MKTVRTTVALAAALALGAPAFASGVAESPASVRPPLVGTAAPSGIEVRTGDGASFDAARPS